MRLPNSAHESRPWRIREIAPDFTLEDVWALPVHGGAEDFQRLLENTVSFDPANADSLPARVLWRVRDRLGSCFGLGRISAPIDSGWDDGARKLPIPGTNETSLADRLPGDLRNTAADLHFDSLPFAPLYRTDVEFAAEASNQTMHGVMHLAWVDQGAGRYRGQMAVYVKPRGLLGNGYMALIKPFRYWLVYPALMRQIEQAWNTRGLWDSDRVGGEAVGATQPVTDIHAVACAVPMDARDLVAPDRFEYADAFAVALPRGTRIAAEDWARAMFMPRGLAQQVLAGAWNAVMGLEPPPTGRVMGPFHLVSVKRESAILVGDGERYRIRLVVLAGEGSLTLATFVQSRGRAWRELLRGILVGHRRVAPLLLERAVAAKTRKHRMD